MIQVHGGGRSARLVLGQSEATPRKPPVHNFEDSVMKDNQLFFQQSKKFVLLFCHRIYL
jgi:hypothetical protein